MAPVSSRIDVGDAVTVTCQDPHRVRVVFPEGPSVPHHQHSVIPPGHQDVGGLVNKTDSVDVIVVGGDPTGLFVCLSVVDIQTTVICSTQQLPTTTYLPVLL